MSERKFNAQLDELLEQIENTLPRKYGQLTKAADRARLTVEDVLAKHADLNGIVPRNKQGAVIREVQRIEGEIYRSIQTELQLVFNSTAEATLMGLSTAIATALNVTALLAVAGLAKALADMTLLLPSLLGKSTDAFIRDLARTPFNRKDSDGLKLNDRLRDIARLLTREVSSTLRTSIQKGEVTSQMNRKVARSFKTLDWRIKTIVETEVLYLMRNGIALFAEYSGIAKGLRIVDYPHGKPGEHERHKCHIYAHADEYGMGEGVYPVTTRKIRHPHPRCRSTLHLVLHDKLRGGR
ncbi:hypothetical protein [Bacillus sp. 7894-2]|uniref:hypothetical protein n=1 Tax=Bacillus sp. 7894-2 TaxID=2021695 RepID=UPI000BA6AC68|nr:hypothetical protein [Bacillus sp. 7894-2]PAE24074.1 hypothetical protein CHI10_14830 [Bacillus sp. 7894-2]